MYKTYEEAKKAAIDTVKKHFGGKCKGLVIVENKKTNRSKSYFGFRFNSIDTNGKFIVDEYGYRFRMFFLITEEIENKEVDEEVKKTKMKRYFSETKGYHPFVSVEY